MTIRDTFSLTALFATPVKTSMIWNFLVVSLGHDAIR
jgi:hypothetical protein